ncbi:hypothetical protein CN689_01030 [Peribacillus butanolivorans]|uniref:HD domain-containing protein n=1 Tax=Peribacillus butanolivorans TaxID=421767 RepID=A0AAX0S9Q2_9BACI|nr:hypothetical protein [Peribacillus butanolivorans]PEJ37514.1 hypothetical protein CN689_01030 [Peribacillus butanolivorans]
MKEILYYPGFEIQDETWLKFALLYMKEIHTIVPTEAQFTLSTDYNLVEKETNLLKKYPPKSIETSRATRKVINIISQYLKKPKRVIENLGEIDIIKVWRQSENQNYELFEGKFIHDFAHFCNEWGFSQLSKNGILIPSQLATTYMGVLAHDIGKRRDMSIITDIEHEEEIVSLSDDLYTYNNDFEEMQYIKNYFTLVLPVNLKDIPIGEIIDLRNQENFQENLKAFHFALNQLSLISDNKLTNLSFKEITENIEWSLKGLKADISNLGSTLLITSLGILLAFKGGEEVLEIIKEVLGFVPAACSGLQLYNNIDSDKRKLATKYLTDLRNIGGSQKRRNKLTNIPII